MKIMFPGAIIITSSNVADSSYANWNDATPYANGATVYLPINYGEYQALTANTNKQPNLNPTDWKFLGTTNKYKMFDQFLNTQTLRTETIEVSIAAYGAEALYLGNIDATTITIEVIDLDLLSVIETKVYTTYRDIVDWQDYYYGDWLEDKVESIVYERTTLTQNIGFNIIIDNGTNDAKCGIFACGRVKFLGYTKWDLNVGALDYSTIAIDSASGATYLSKGNYAKKLGIDIFTHTNSVNAVFKTLTNARGIPVVFIPGQYELLNVYCYIQKFEELVKGPVETVITCEVIGLI
jgi:hypothetical protein